MRLEQIDKALGDSRLQTALYSATARLGDGRRKIVMRSCPAIRTSASVRTI